MKAKSLFLISWYFISCLLFVLGMGIGIILNDKIVNGLGNGLIFWTGWWLNIFCRWIKNKADKIEN